MKSGAVVATQLEGDSFVEGLGQDHVARVLLMNISIQFKTKILMAVTVAVTFSTREPIRASPLHAVKDPTRKKCHYVLISEGQEKHFDHLETIPAGASAMTWSSTYVLLVLLILPNNNLTCLAWMTGS